MVAEVTGVTTDRLDGAEYRSPTMAIKYLDVWNESPVLIGEAAGRLLVSASESEKAGAARAEESASERDPRYPDVTIPAESKRANDGLTGTA
ncbi:MAG: hypothetical protein ACXWWE_02715 [Nitrospira sp.]